MHRWLALAAALAFLGACSGEGGGCGEEKKPSSESSAPSAGGAATGGGGLGEPVSFQGTRAKDTPPPAQDQAPTPAAKPVPQAAPAAAPAAASAPQSGSVLCGGFPNLAADCSKDPSFDAIKKKCCPTGQVDQCQAIPGGARLIGRGCAN